MHDCVEQAVLGEKMGFDRVWAVEHHCLKWYAHMSAPETFLAYVAGKTSSGSASATAWSACPSG